MTLPASYFDAMYTAADDPWGFSDRWYERRKYAVTLAALPRERYRRGFEPGCSIGVLTAQLAGRCDELLATDVADAAVAATTERLSGVAGVDVRRMAVPGEWPDGRFDLVVLSEMAYYLSRSDLGLLVERLAASLDDDGDLVAVHWRHEVEDYPLTGDEVHTALAAAPGLVRTVSHVEDDFVLEVFSRGGRSVAQLTGLVP